MKKQLKVWIVHGYGGMDIQLVTKSKTKCIDYMKQHEGKNVKYNNESCGFAYENKEDEDPLFSFEIKDVV